MLDKLACALTPGGSTFSPSGRDEADGPARFRDPSYVIGAVFRRLTSRLQRPAPTRPYVTLPQRLSDCSGKRHREVRPRAPLRRKLAGASGLNGVVRLVVVCLVLSVNMRCGPGL